MYKVLMLSFLVVVAVPYLFYFAWLWIDNKRLAKAKEPYVYSGGLMHPKLYRGNSQIKKQKKSENFFTLANQNTEQLRMLRIAIRKQLEISKRQKSQSLAA